MKWRHRPGQLVRLSEAIRATGIHVRLDGGGFGHRLTSDDMLVVLKTRDTDVLALSPRGSGWVYSGYLEEVT